MGSFLADTCPRRDEGVEGRFASYLGEDWSIVFAFGGATMATIVRALDAAVDNTDLRMVAAHAQFVSPVPSGPVFVDTEIVRAGRSVAQVAAELNTPDAAGPAVRCSGTWASPRVDHPVTGRGVAPPPVSRPGSPELIRIEHDPPWDQFPIQSKFEEWRCPGYSQPHALFVDGESPQAAVWLRMTDDARHDNGRFEPAALALVADRAPGPHLGPCLEPTPDIEFAPLPLVSLEAALRVYGEPATDWLLLHSRVDDARDGHVATRVDIWDEAMDLIATSEQLARYGDKPVT